MKRHMILMAVSIENRLLSTDDLIVVYVTAELFEPAVL
jgi:hypothetical protein